MNARFFPQLLNMSTATRLPPGLSGDLEEYMHGGDSSSWMLFDKTRFYTNAFVTHEGRV